MKTGQRQNCLFMRLNGYTGGMKMNELELKYGCNPNQKPSRIFMADGSETSDQRYFAANRDISISWMRSMAGSW